ncbi:MAG: caspase family protein [Promethearchaeota archaeon]
MFKSNKKAILILFAFILPTSALLSISYFSELDVKDETNDPLGEDDQKLKISDPLEPRTGYAVVIGISDYPGSSYDLSYCDDDAQDVRDMLINDYNFKPENIIYLQDSAATRDAISSALDTIAAQADSNDVFYFYYSGHGGTDYTSASTVYYSLDSPHPYSNDMDTYYSIYHPGAALMRVHFDRIETEYTYDYVFVGDSDIQYGYIYDYFTGTYSSGAWSAWVPVLSDERIWINLYTDYSNTGWGFSIDRYEVREYDDTQYLCPYDSITDDSRSYWDTLLNTKLDAIACEEKYVFSDSCHSGGMIPESADPGVYMTMASAYNEYSLEDSAREQGCFTYYLLRSLDYATDSNGDNMISMEECFDYIYPNTVSRSGALGYTFHPQESDGITGESILQTGLGNVAVSNTTNQLTYSFDVHGIGEIKNLTLITYFINNTNLIYQEEDLLLTSTDPTGFETYADTTELEGATQLSGYSIEAQIESNELRIFTQQVSGDFDNDTINDLVEIGLGLDPRFNDTDNDGLLDGVEYYGDTDPLSNDTDSDGLIDGDEVNIYLTSPISNDTDDDGLDDYFEIFTIFTNATNPDSDDDGMGDGYEYYNNLNWTIDDSASDYDMDGLSNLLESQIGSSANNTDSDYDTMPDIWEYNNNLNLTSDDSASDYDGDGLSNLLEFQIGTQANDTDSDDDGMGDGYEYYNDLNWTVDDSASDYDMDGLSNLLESQIGSSANNTDSDYDTMPDIWEYNNNLNLTSDDSASDYDGDGLSNLLEFQIGTLANDTDYDNDGMGDGYEYYNNLNWTVDDSASDYDMDGLPNLVEFYYSSDPWNPDTDGDQLDDGLEIVYGTDILDPDTDNDGTPDGVEVMLGLDPLDPKSSILTLVFNISGIIGIIAVAGFTVVAAIVQKKKKTNVRAKYKGAMKFKGKLESYNGVRVHEASKPVERTSYSPYSQHSRPKYQSTTNIGSVLSNMNPTQMRAFLLDFIKNKLPSPTLPGTLQGQKALYIGQKAIQLMEQQRVSEALDAVFQALLLGVPEPLNSQFQGIILRLAGVASDSGKFKETSSNINDQTKTPSTKLCPSCGEQNPTTNRFCTKCGRQM